MPISGCRSAPAPTSSSSAALINFVLEHDRVFREYVVAYTNAAVARRARTSGTRGSRRAVLRLAARTSRTYDTTTLAVRAATSDGRTAARSDAAASALRVSAARSGTSRATRRRWSSASAASRATRSSRSPIATRACSGPDRTATICYAVGLTQHSVGVQIVRSAAILQLLLGNVGRPGGGILALRGHASIQGSTDIPTLYDLLPGYLPMPAFGAGQRRRSPLHRHVIARAPGCGHNFDEYIVSLLKAWYGDAATRANDFGFGWLPRISGDHSHQGYWLDMADGKMDGLFVMGQNPAVGAPNAALERRALAKLKWLVVRDMVEVETATFWKDSPEVAVRRARRPTTSAPRCSSSPPPVTPRRTGTFTNTQRLLQWHEKAVDPPGDCRSDAWFMYHLGRRLKARAPRTDAARERRPARADVGLPDRRPARRAGRAKPCCSEINGRQVGTGVSMLPASPSSPPTDRRRAAAGSTPASCPSAGENRARRSSRAAGLYGHGWGYAWPADRRILYNRASARPDGRRGASARSWSGGTSARPSGPDTTRPISARAPAVRRTCRPPERRGHRRRSAGEAGRSSCTPTASAGSGCRRPEGRPAARRTTSRSNRRSANPLLRAAVESGRRSARASGQPLGVVARSAFPARAHDVSADGASHRGRHVAHALAAGGAAAGALLRALARAGGARSASTTATRSGSSPRAARFGRARSSPRACGRSTSTAARASGRAAVAFGQRGLVTGDVANDLIAMSEEPNVRIMESKALICRVEKLGSRAARLPRSAISLPMPTTGFFTDSTLCIGCKACEVACKEWNDVPADGFAWTGKSYDNTGSLGHSTWRHVKFVERDARRRGRRGTFSSDVCKHCEHAGCLEACPTGVDRPHRVRRRLHPARRLQRLRLLRRHLPVRRHRSPARRRPRVQVHVLLRPAEGRAAAGVRARRARRSRFSSAISTSCACARRSASRELRRARRRRTPSSTIRAHTSVGGTHAIFLVRGDVPTTTCPPNPEVPTRTSRSLAGRGPGLGGLLGVIVLAFAREQRRGACSRRAMDGTSRSATGP